MTTPVPVFLRGKRLSVEIAMRGMNQSGFARKFGCSAPLVSNWCRDAVEPTDVNKVRIAEVLEVPVEQVFGWWDETVEEKKTGGSHE